MKTIKLFTAFIFISISLFSQNPPSIKWYQISSEHFNVVYEKGLDNYAKEVLINLEKAYVIDTQTYKVAPRKISLYLFNRAAISNAYARLAPRQMVWYILPSPNTSLSITPWTELLAVHEYRHVVQYKALNKYFTKLGYYAFGQFGQLILENYSVPNWFWEGDAVYNETVYTKSGRGRISEFDLPIRTMLLENKPYKFEPFLFRSYKTYYPNHYYLGYFMVSYVNQNFGQPIWNKILQRTSKFSFYPFIFSNSLKRFTGLNTKKLFYKTYSNLDSLWTEKYKNYEITESKPFYYDTTKNKIWTNYTSAYFIDDTTVICVKSGLDDNPQLTVIQGNKTSKIKEIASTKISFAKDKIIWAEDKPHLRWDEVIYSVIVSYDLKTKKIKYLTKKSYYYSPDLSPDGKKIAAVEYTPETKCSLVILDAQNGDVLQKFPSPNNDYIRFPRWSDDGKKIVFTHSSKKGQAISILDLETGLSKQIIDYQWIRIKYPRIWKNFVLFNYDPDGIANIYAIDLTTKKIFKVISRPYGIDYFTIYKDKILFSDYTYYGYKLAWSNLQEKQWKPIDIQNNRLNYFKIPNQDISISVDTSNFKISKYNELKNLINFHSWLLYPYFYEYYEENSIKNYYLSLNLFSANKLHTLNFVYSLESSLYKPVFYNKISLSYKKYFPIINLDIGFGKKTTNYYASVQTYDIKQIAPSIVFPFNFSKGMYYRTLNLGIKNSFSQITADQQLISSNEISGQYNMLNSWINFTNRKYQAYRDVKPRWGQEINFGYKSIPVGEYKSYGYQFTSKVYLPSVFKHHSITLKYSKTAINVDGEERILYYSPQSPLFLQGDFHNIFTLLDAGELYGIYYDFPICYPDWGINPLIYFKRIRAKLFFEYYSDKGKEYSIFSTESFYRENKIFGGGIQILADIHILRINYFMFNIGIQFSLNNKNNYISLAQVVEETPIFTF